MEVLRRAWQLSRSVVTRLVVPWALRRQPTPRAERMQAVLEEVGGLWVKLGQALALRFDVLPADYCLQFFQLLNQIQPFAAEDARSIIEAELGRPVEAIFRSFDWQPHAAASIGQVYRAELADGTPIAVKVQRPRIRELVRADLALMRWLAALVDLTHVFGQTRARSLVAEFARWTDEELDYRIEARHAAVLRRNAESDPLERNPRVYPVHTTARVLTVEYLDGIPVIDIITAIRRRDAAFLDRLAERGHDARRIASHIVWNALNQIYRFGYFHADPHPANLLVLSDDAIGYVDFGIVGKLDDQTTRALRYFAQSLFAGHTGIAVDEFMRFLTPSARTDVRAARRELRRKRAGGSGGIQPDGGHLRDRDAGGRANSRHGAPSGCRAVPEGGADGGGDGQGARSAVRPTGPREPVLRAVDGTRGDRGAGSAAAGSADTRRARARRAGAGLD
jgi:ubiquinone biosynthesis protein